MLCLHFVILPNESHVLGEIRGYRAEPYTMGYQAEPGNQDRFRRFMVAIDLVVYIRLGHQAVKKEGGTQ
ncbi:MAG: hypothetical protein WBG50_11130 [Desulfomonilaceae bacterium]